jgi:hypothetical protein
MLLLAKGGHTSDATEDRRKQRWRQLRSMDKAYSAHLAQEYKRSKLQAADTLAAEACREWAEDRGRREAALQAEYDAALASIGRAHEAAAVVSRGTEQRASEQYWAFVRSQEAELARHERAASEARRRREEAARPRVELLERRRRAREQSAVVSAHAVAQARSTAAARSRQRPRSAPQQPAVGGEASASEPADERGALPVSTSTHVHAMGRRGGGPAHTFSAPSTSSSCSSAFELAQARALEADTQREAAGRAASVQRGAAEERGREALARVRRQKQRARAREEHERSERAQRVEQVRARHPPDIPYRSPRSHTHARHDSAPTPPRLLLLCAGHRSRGCARAAHQCCAAAAAGSHAGAVRARDRPGAWSLVPARPLPLPRLTELTDWPDGLGPAGAPLWPPVRCRLPPPRD